ncbi:hypothetical protein C8R43DRAFT_316764 [Mycena crocata]|nr:hypothetical protein C8R43DRAFT_316764 [Mycena crocata]
MPNLSEQPVFTYGVIAGEGTGAANIVPSKTTTRTCDLRGCQNYENLNKCSRCRTAMYCSKACQKTDWAHHKSSCQLAADLEDPNADGEPQLQRHLRLWCSRFTGSLVCAAIVALDLRPHPTNIDNFGLVVSLQPRPHAEAGARFDLVDAVVTPMAKIEAVMGYRTAEAKAGGPHVMELHKQHRDERKKGSGGEEDYATCVVMAQNLGLNRLPGGPRTEIRFKPIGVHRAMVHSAQLADPTLDWRLTLKHQVQDDIPNQEVVE